MAVMSWGLRGRTDRIQAFAQTEVEQTLELEHAVFISSPLPSAFSLCCFFWVGVC